MDGHPVLFTVFQAVGVHPVHQFLTEGAGFGGGFPQGGLNIGRQGVPVGFADHADHAGEAVGGGQGIVQHVAAAACVVVRKAEQLAVDGSLLERGVDFREAHGGGNHFQGFGQHVVHGGSRGAHLDALQGRQIGNGALVGHVMTVGAVRVHQRHQVHLGQLFVHVAAQLALVEFPVQSFLLRGIDDEGKIKGHGRGPEDAQIGRSATAHLEVAALGGFGYFAVAAEYGAFIHLYGDLAAGMGGGQFPELSEGLGIHGVRGAVVREADVVFSG